MSRIGSPQIARATSTHSTAYAALERLSRQTPDLDDGDVPETSPRTECRFLLYQGWGGNEPIIVEQNRKKIENQQYWKERQLSYQYSQPAPPTHTTLEQEDSVLLSRSVDLGLLPSKRVVQRGRVQNDGVNTGRESEQQEPPSASSAMEELVKDEELGLPGPSKPTSGKETTSLTTLGDGKAATLRSSNKRTKSKKAANKLHRRAETRSESKQKSARIEKKQQTTTREYRLRSKLSPQL
ncbi:hypothetical protein ACQKWADRAFT_315832 [Trichoderma austrokoningii]